MNMDYPGNLYVVCAASGTGKSSLVKAWRQADAQLALSVSHTTRAPRGQERDGHEYHFVSAAAFDQLLAEGAFVEWAHVHGQRYGTSRQALADALRSGADLVLEIDYQGALQIKQQFPHAALIFVLPPSWDELRQRLQRRAEDSAEVIELRLRNAVAEVAQVDRFDFVIINDSFERALLDLQTIAQAQRLRVATQRRQRAAIFAALQI